jgi:hypothetical protein
MRFRLGHRVSAKVKDTGCEHSIGTTLSESIYEVVKIANTA